MAHRICQCSKKNDNFELSSTFADSRYSVVACESRDVIVMGLFYLFGLDYYNNCFSLSVNPEKLVELIRRDYKGAVLCPFPWCEDELQLKLSNIFTRLRIVSRTKDRARLTDDTFSMTEIFRPHKECDNPRVVLIEGNPGMGKTTYCQKLAYDWSVGNIPPEASFPAVEMLLLLKCRDMKMETADIEEA